MKCEVWLACQQWLKDDGAIPPVPKLEAELVAPNNDGRSRSSAPRHAVGGRHQRLVFSDRGGRPLGYAASRSDSPSPFGLLGLIVFWKLDLAVRSAANT
jgi:hypothetical protein